MVVTTSLAEDAPKTAKGDKDKVVRQIVDNWIQIGTEQYKRGFYAAAEKSFMRAKDYEESLTAEERAKLDQSLQMAHKAAAEQAAKPGTAGPSVPQPEAKPVVEQPKEQVVVETTPEVAVAPPSAQPEQEQGYIGVINRRISVIRSRVKAVVNDSAAKADGFIAQGQFDKAGEAVEVAERTVYENQQQLGDYLFNQYSGQLKQLSERIADGQKTQAQQKEDEKRTKAESSQKEYREQMSSEREKRISDLFQNTRNFEKQKRYEDALSQIEMLLAIDPQNNQALIEKQMLEDTISYRKQIDVEKEKNGEKFKTMIKTGEATIPYAEEMNYPKNWRDIIAKPARQQPEEVVGQESADAEVDKQLDTVVNLSELSIDMPLREAINLIKNSVSPPLNITVQWLDLYNNANIEQTTAINMDPLTNVTVRTALDLLLQSVSGGVSRLGYVVQNGVVIVATQQTLPTNMPTRVYDVTVLLGRPADYYVSSSASSTGSSSSSSGGGGGGGGSAGNNGGTYQETFDQQGTDTDIDRATLLSDAIQRMNDLITLIEDNVDRQSWYDTGGGEATITAYETKKLIIRQTLKNHHDIEELLRNMRKNLGNQVSIEARFLVVGENFLEEIGLDAYGNLFLGNTLGTSTWNLNSFEMAEPQATGVPGGFDVTKTQVAFPTATSGTISTGAIMGFFGGRFGGVLDGLEANFLIRATQAHRDSESLIAPKVTVLSGESATLQVKRTFRFALQGASSATATSSATNSTGSSTYTAAEYDVPTGPTLNITPTITPDKKHVLLNVTAELQDFLSLDKSTVQAPVLGTNGQVTVVEYQVFLPQTERSLVRTRVSVPDGGTLLLGGTKRSASTETEVGVPVLSKIPLLGRIFTNRSKVADQQVLLILVKPTIILQDEADAEAVAAMEDQH